MQSFYFYTGEVVVEAYPLERKVLEFLLDLFSIRLFSLSLTLESTFVEEHKNSNNSPYKFNGKELDDETGNYYYGARYYDPKWSFWLSVDPLAEKDPSLSPYIYTANNPIKYVDPNGEDIYLSFINDAAKDAYKKAIKKATGGAYKATIAPRTGKVSLVATGQGSMTDKQKRFYKAYSNIANDSKNNVHQKVVNTNLVNVGSWKNGTLDIGDVQQFDEAGEGGNSSAGILLFETTEQWLKAKMGLEPGQEGKVKIDANGNRILVQHNTAHEAATKIVDKVQGNELKDQKRGGLERTFLEPDGSKTHQTIQLKESNDIHKPWIQPIKVNKTKID